MKSNINLTTNQKKLIDNFIHYLDNIIRLINTHKEIYKIFFLLKKEHQIKIENFDKKVDLNTKKLIKLVEKNSDFLNFEFTIELVRKIKLNKTIYKWLNKNIVLDMDYHFEFIKEDKKEFSKEKIKIQYQYFLFEFKIFFIYPLKFRKLLRKKNIKLLNTIFLKPKTNKYFEKDIKILFEIVRSYITFNSKYSYNDDVDEPKYFYDELSDELYEKILYNFKSKWLENYNNLNKENKELGDWIINEYIYDVEICGDTNDENLFYKLKNYLKKTQYL